MCVCVCVLVTTTFAKMATHTATHTAEYQTGPPGCHGEQGQDARGGDPEDNRAAMAASGTS